MKRIAILGLKEDDFGVASNLMFSNHGPSVPKSFLQRGALGMTRAKVAVSAMSNMNDVIKNLRYNQNLTDPMSIGYINIQAKKVRTTVAHFEEVHEEILKWVASCVVPFHGIVWVDANWMAVSRTPRHLVPHRPLILQSITQPFFRPVDAPATAVGNERRGSAISIPPIVLSSSNPSGRTANSTRGGGGSTRLISGQENRNPFGPSTSAIALRRARKVAPGGIYSNNRNPGPYTLPDQQRGRTPAIGSRPAYGHFITKAYRQSCGPGPSYKFSSFGHCASSRPASSMSARRPSGHKSRSSRSQRPSTVGSTSPRIPFGRSKRFHHPPAHSGISEVPIMINETVCMVRSQTPGPRYFLGVKSDTLGGRSSTSMGLRRSQTCAKQTGAPSAFMSTSPRW